MAGLGASRGRLGLEAHRGQHPRRLDQIDVAHEIMWRIDRYIPILEIRRQPLDFWSVGILRYIHDESTYLFGQSTRLVDTSCDDLLGGYLTAYIYAADYFQAKA